MANPNPVPKLYRNVVDEVIKNVREAFLNDGVDEQVLQELKQIWESKLMQSRAIDSQSGAADPTVAQKQQLYYSAQVLPLHQQATVSSVPNPIQGRQMAANQQRVAYPAVGQIGHMTQQGATLSIPGITSVQSVQQPAAQFQTYHQAAVKTIQPNPGLQAQTDLLNIQHQQQQQQTQRLITNKPPNTQPQLQQPQLQHIQHALPNKLPLQPQTQQPQPQRILSKPPQQQQQQQQQQLQQQQQQQQKQHLVQGPVVIQVDGANDSGSEENDDDDDDDDTAGPDGLDFGDNPEEEEEEDPLNSEDDVSEDDSTDLFDTDNVVVCQFDKIARIKNKWKFHLKDGIMNLRGKDYVFQKATGEAEW